MYETASSQSHSFNRHDFLLSDFFWCSHLTVAVSLQNIWIAVGAYVIVHTTCSVPSSSSSSVRALPLVAFYAVCEKFTEEVLSVFPVLEVVIWLAPERRSKVGRHGEKKSEPASEVLTASV